MAEATLGRFPDVHLTATDVDPAMLFETRRRLRRTGATVQPADATALPFQPDAFDHVTSYLMLHHVVEWRQALSEVNRVLRPGGTFVGYDLTDSPVARWIHRLDRSPHRLFSSDELTVALVDAGLGDVDLRTGALGHLVRFSARKRRRARAD